MTRLGRPGYGADREASFPGIVRRPCRHRLCDMRAPHIIALVLSSVSALAQTATDLSSWHEAGQLKDPSLRAAARRSCALMRKEALTQNPNGSWQLTNDPFTHLRGSNAQFCPTMPFHGQPRPASPFSGRSGFLVGPDLILTAAHQIPNDLAFVQASFQFVFDWHVTKGMAGLEPPSLVLPSDAVYTATEIVAHGPSLVGSGPESFYFDFMLIRLDRPVAGNRGIMRLRRTTSPPLALGDSVVTVGYPDGLPVKAAVAGYVAHLTDSSAFNPWGSITLFSSPGLPGSSGGMYYNPARDFVESVATYAGSMTFFDFGGCLLLGTNCGPCSPQSSGSSIRMFSQFVPQLELLVAPQAPADHATTAGLAYSRSSTHFVDLGDAASGATDVLIVDLSPPSPATATPQVSAHFYAPDASGRQHLYPGERGQVEVTATVAPTVPAGTYVNQFAIVDGRWGFRDVIEHRFIVAPGKKE